MIDYQKYEFGKKEFMMNLGVSLLITSFLAYVFYRSIIAVVVFAPASYCVLKWRKKQLIKKRLWELNLQFREGILSISAALSAGYSIENAFAEAVRDLSVEFDESAMIIQEFQYIISRINMNDTVEDALLDFAERTQLEDIENFAEVFATAKRTGGDLIKIIRSTSKSIGDKIDIKREILTMITGKKFEANIMSFIPIGIILYMWLVSPGYLDPLYHNVAGIGTMTIILIVYAVVFLVIQRIMDIQV